jgi:predicted transcriptional regulator
MYVIILLTYNNFYGIFISNLKGEVMDVKEWAKLQESLLKSQLKIIREFLRQGEEPTFKPRKKGRSQMSIIYDILLTSQKPLHVTEIITRAKEDFNMDLDRESIVSAIIKKVKSGRMFKRVAPNTFTLLDSPLEKKI